MWDIGIGTFLEGIWIVFLLLSTSGTLVVILGAAYFVGRWNGRHRR
jgi:hypothetical protein